MIVCFKVQSMIYWHGDTCIVSTTIGIVNIKSITGSLNSEVCGIGHLFRRNVTLVIWLLHSGHICDSSFVWKQYCLYKTDDCIWVLQSDRRIFKSKVIDGALQKLLQGISQTPNDKDARFVNFSLLPLTHRIECQLATREQTTLHKDGTFIGTVGDVEEIILYVQLPAPNLDQVIFEQLFVEQPRKQRVVTFALNLFHQPINLLKNKGHDHISYFHRIRGQPPSTAIEIKSFPPNRRVIFLQQIFPTNF
mmetsp:Transcript_28079/g.43019  ORF Transcript_28079/g.43019 Transcript_28079/m.43019 type:complete len:249 (-) Transcript_28079:298-1044(-)